jgi:hypothetical protein
MAPSLTYGKRNTATKIRERHLNLTEQPCFTDRQSTPSIEYFIVLERAAPTQGAQFGRKNRIAGDLWDWIVCTRRQNFGANLDGQPIWLPTNVGLDVSSVQSHYQAPDAREERP